MAEASVKPVPGVGLLTRITGHLPPGQLVRYLLVGTWNTIFGYSTFAAINWLLYRYHVKASYIYAYAFSNCINITVAYLGYKFFVFKTKGNYLKEWLKAMAVSWTGFPLGVALLAAAVRIVNWILPPQFMLLNHIILTKQAAPYVGNAFTLGISVVYSFVAHKNVTFRQPRQSVNTKS